MNWLAHIFLSENHIEYQHGNLMADLLKGRSWAGASHHFKAGLAMHRAIDSFTDSHPQVIRSKSRLGRGGRLKGVVIDIAYDHLLARNWHKYARIPLPAFIDAFHARSSVTPADYPEPARLFLLRLVRSGHLRDYVSLTGVERALHRIDGRLSQRVRAKERSLDYLLPVRDEMDNIERDFLDFMPELIQHFKSAARLSRGDHWLA